MDGWNNIDQRTTEWHDLRRGLFTSSEIYNLFVKPRGKEEFSKTALSYITQKAMDLVYPLHIENFTNYAMQWGVDHEDLAISVYELATGNDVNNGGFFRFDDNTGSSPDGLIGPKGLIEVKCPYNRANHFNNVLDLRDDYDLYKKSKQYYYQCHHQIFCSNRQWVDFCSFDARLLESKNFLHVIRVERNQDLMVEMAEVIYRAGIKRDELVSQFLNTRNEEIPKNQRG